MVINEVELYAIFDRCIEIQKQCEEACTERGTSYHQLLISCIQICQDTKLFMTQNKSLDETSIKMIIECMTKNIIMSYECDMAIITEKSVNSKCGLNCFDECGRITRHLYNSLKDFLHKNEYMYTSDSENEDDNKGE